MKEIIKRSHILAGLHGYCLLGMQKALNTAVVYVSVVYTAQLVKFVGQ